MSSQEKRQLGIEEIELLINEFGLENMEAHIKLLKKRKRKGIADGVNFPVRLPRDVLDWYKHYTKAFGQTAATRFMGKVLMSYTEENVDEYPMLETFGKVIAVEGSRGRKKKDPQGDDD